MSLLTPQQQLMEGTLETAKRIQAAQDLLEDSANHPDPEISLPAAESLVIDQRRFIESEFMIRAKEEEVGQNMGYTAPFRLNKVQLKYFNQMVADYGPRLDGVREIILKARQQGFSSFVLALFAVDFITRPQSVSVCISHQSEATKRLFKRVKFYIESYCIHNNINVADYLSVDTKEGLENATNGAYFYIGTAGAKVGGRGDTVTNVHFSEAAFYEETDKITPKEIIESTVQQVPQNHGMVFMESTGGHYGSYFQGEWERAKNKESNYKPRFFSWNEFYSQEWIDIKKKDFQSEEQFKSHYPNDDTEAFLFSGMPFFNRTMLAKLINNAIDPIEEGFLAPDGSFI